jgi:multidrug efflux pump subunit AcrB
VTQEFGAGGVRVGYAGDLVTGLQEYGAVRNDLLQVGALGIGLILLAIFLYYMHVRAVLALGIAITAGCAWTFAATQLVIGHLNVATGFLFSIVAGNGINFGIIFLGRYVEEVRHGKTVNESIHLARATTWRATLTAVLAATAAYGSLYVSEFQGLRQFAIIGALGMLLCWLAAYLILPSLLIVFHRIVPTEPISLGSWSRFPHGLRYEAPFTWVVKRVPASILVLGAFATLASVIALVRSVGRDPMEYEMKRLFNQVGQANEQKRLSSVAREIIGVSNESSMAILCDHLDQVPELAGALHTRWLAAPAGSKPFEAVHSIHDFIPTDQEMKLPLIEKIRVQLTRAKSRGLLAGKEWQNLAQTMPKESLDPFGVPDLPESIARPFTERDGQRGRVVYIEPTHGADEDDVRYLMQWANSFRITRLKSGNVVYGSGRIVLFADIIAAVLHDMPFTSLLSFVMTAGVVLLTVRNRKDSALILCGLLLGVVWLAGLFVASGSKLNFLNFMALPITFGIGVDYAVNFVQRFRQNPELSVLGALHAGGGAVVLCSLTTSLGYIALLGSKNQAVHSLGLMAVLGEISCLLAALLVIPAALVLLRRARRTNSQSSSIDESAAVVTGNVLDDPC